MYQPSKTERSQQHCRRNTYVKIIKRTGRYTKTNTKRKSCTHVLRTGGPPNNSTLDLVKKHNRSLARYILRRSICDIICWGSLPPYQICIAIFRKLALLKIKQNNLTAYMFHQFFSCALKKKKYAKRETKPSHFLFAASSWSPSRTSPLSSTGDGGLMWMERSGAIGDGWTERPCH